MNDDLLIPFPVDGDSDYFTPAFPSSYELTEEGGAAALMRYFDEQAALVPDLYKGEPFNVQDLDEYQDLISRFINYYANKQLPTNEGLPYSRSSE